MYVYVYVICDHFMRKTLHGFIYNKMKYNIQCLLRIIGWETHLLLLTL